MSGDLRGVATYGPKDVIWVEDVRILLGEKFGPAGLYIVERLWQIAEADLKVSSNVQWLARDCFVDPETTAAVLAFTAELGVTLDMDARRLGFTCRLEPAWRERRIFRSSRAPLARRRVDHVMRARVMRRYNFTCEACGYRVNGDWTDYDGRKAPADNDRVLHLDHVLPISRGGADDEANIQVLCAPCNQSKGARA